MEVIDNELSMRVINDELSTIRAKFPEINDEIIDEFKQYLNRLGYFENENKILFNLKLIEKLHNYLKIQQDVAVQNRQFIRIFTIKDFLEYRNRVDNVKFLIDKIEYFNENPNIKILTDDLPTLVQRIGNDNYLLQLKCGHIFHSQCIKNVLNYAILEHKITELCPICRQEIQIDNFTRYTGQFEDICAICMVDGRKKKRKSKSKFNSIRKRRKSKSNSIRKRKSKSNSIKRRKSKSTKNIKT